MRKTSFALGIIFFGVVWAATAGGNTVLLEGSHSISYDIINPKGLKKIPEYRNQSFSQRIIESDQVSMKVVVTINLDPVPSTGLFPIPPESLPEEIRMFLQPEEDIPSAHPRIMSMAQEITSGVATAGDAYHRIIDWVMDYLDYEIDTPQDTFSVAKNKKGSCVGFSNLSISLLRAAGIPARYVSGYLPPGYEGETSRRENTLSLPGLPDQTTPPGRQEPAVHGPGGQRICLSGISVPQQRGCRAF